MKPFWATATRDEWEEPFTSGLTAALIFPHRLYLMRQSAVRAFMVSGKTGSYELSYHMNILLRSVRPSQQTQPDAVRKDKFSGSIKRRINLS